MIPGLEHARTSILQADFHFTPQHEQPLRCAGTVKLAAETHGAFT